MNKALTFALKLSTAAFVGPMRAAQGSIQGMLSVGSKIGNIATGLSSAGGMLQTVLGTLNRPITLAAEMEDLQNSFSAMLGDGAKAAELVKQLQGFAATTTFAGAETIKSGRLLLAFGVSAQNVTKTLKTLGNVASAVNMPLDDLSEIFGKARVQGTLFAEDINQMTGRGIPVIQELARVLGVTEGAVKKMASEGKVNFSALEQAFNNLGGAGGRWGGMMEKIAGGFRVKWENLKDTLDELWRKFGTPLTNSLKPVLDDLNRLVQDMTPQAENFGKVLGEGIGNVRDLFLTGNLWKAAGIGLTIAGKEFVNVLNMGVQGTTAMLFSGLGDAVSIFQKLASNSSLWDGLKFGLLSAAEHFKASLKDGMADVLAALPTWMVDNKKISDLRESAAGDRRAGSFYGGVAVESFKGADLAGMVRSLGVALANGSAAFQEGVRNAGVAMPTDRDRSALSQLISDTKMQAGLAGSRDAEPLYKYQKNWVPQSRTSSTPFGEITVTKMVQQFERILNPQALNRMFSGGDRKSGAEAQILEKILSPVLQIPNAMQALGDKFSSASGVATF